MLMENNKKPAARHGISRILFAFKYTMQGFGYALKNVPAFRQELILFSLLIPLSFFMNISDSLRLLMGILALGVLVSELLNSAVESVVDMVSPDYHELAKAAKDMGSAAVFLAFTAFFTAFIFACYFHFYQS
jgi:diacylglycerol kinase (ATP)